MFNLNKMSTFHTYNMKIISQCRLRGIWCPWRYMTVWFPCLDGVERHPNSASCLLNSFNTIGHKARGNFHINTLLYTIAFAIQHLIDENSIIARQACLRQRLAFFGSGSRHLAIDQSHQFKSKYVLHEIYIYV